MTPPFPIEKIEYVSGRYLIRLQQKVNEKIKEGFVPFGILHEDSNSNFIQTMVLPSQRELLNPTKNE